MVNFFILKKENFIRESILWQSAINSGENLFIEYRRRTILAAFR